MMPTDTSTFDFQRNFKLPPQRLWQVLTDPQYRAQWAGPDADTVLTTVSSDVSVGGEDRQCCGPVDAPEYEVTTRWYDLTTAERAVFTETLIFGGHAVCTSLVTYSLSQTAGGSALDINVAVSSFTGNDTLGEVQMGWGGGVENLAVFCAKLSADA